MGASVFRFALKTGKTKLLYTYSTDWRETLTLAPSGCEGAVMYRYLPLLDVYSQDALAYHGFWRPTAFQTLIPVIASDLPVSECSIAFEAGMQLEITLGLPNG